MRTPVLAANWKMFKTTHETLAYVRELGTLTKAVDGVEIVVAPPFTSLATAAEAARNTNVGIAAQNLYFEREGAFTGEVSASMIKDAGATHVIVGHSERRRIFGDTDEWVNRKTRAAIAAESVLLQLTLVSDRKPRIRIVAPKLVGSTKYVPISGECFQGKMKLAAQPAQTPSGNPYSKDLM